MFGLLIPSRPIQPAPHETLSATQFAFSIPPTPSFSHLAIFLLPGNVLPPDALAAIYIKIPGAPPAPGTTNGFRLLGALAADKQSAVFRVAGIGGSGTAGAAAGGGMQTDETGVREEIMLDDVTGAPVQASEGGDPIVVGVSVEPAVQVTAQLEAIRNTSAQSGGQQQMSLTRRGAVSGAGADTQPPSTPVIQRIAKRIGQHAFNFLSGFATRQGGADVVPVKRLEEWWTKFDKRIEMDAGFLLKEGDG